ncbi:hypothetical protein [Marinobacter sp. KMM 10035]|uniref:hypothetical protein n=1 Tax=Marinobacter sp. KMM 10035 TaxID=3134034 RepID=UPI00397CD647
MKRSIKRVVDNLSFKYEFFYLVKTNKKKAIFFSLAYLAFVFYVIYEIYDRGAFYGLASNIFTFFVDIGIVFLITVFFLVVRSLHNDEKGRIIEKDNLQIGTVVPINMNFSEVKVQFNRHDFYNQPREIETLLKWVDFNKDDYFRTHYGSLDVPKFSIDGLSLESGILKVNCSSTSFFDITFTHYFPDYPLSSSDTTTKVNEKTLRSLLSADIERHYASSEFSKVGSMEFFDLLPNPIGITGIVEIAIEGEDPLYILQARLSADAAAKDKIQHSFAGTIDLFPNLYREDVTLKDMVDTELFDEVVDQTIGNSVSLKELESDGGVLRENKLLGLVINPLYLYQPEFFVRVKYTVPGTYRHLPLVLQLKQEAKVFKTCLSKGKSLPKRKGNLYVCTRDCMDSLVDNDKISTRNLFPVGLNLLKHSETSTEHAPPGINPLPTT